jgi:hypothetical protein
VVLAARDPSPGPWAHQAGLIGEHHRLDPVAELELGQQVGDVALDGGVADEQLGGDLGIGQAPGDELEDLLLAVGEPGDRLGGAGRGESRTYCSITRRVIEGASSASPAAATRTAVISCSGGAFLSRKPLAPTVRAWYTYSSRSKVVRITTREPDPAATIWWVASSPSRLGMRMSISTTSGRSRRVAATASTPSPASPATSRSAWVSRIIRNPARTSSWSSASRTRTV